MTVTAPPSPSPRSAALPRLLAGLGHQEVLSLTEHERRYGLLWLRGPSGRRRPERLIDIVEAAGLTGRGGAGFPTGRKMRSVAGRGETVVVANGAEGEPGQASLSPCRTHPAVLLKQHGSSATSPSRALASVARA